MKARPTRSRRIGVPWFFCGLDPFLPTRRSEMNVVLAIIGVMVMGPGLYRAGIAEQIAKFILPIAGKSKRHILSTVSVTVGVICPASCKTSARRPSSSR